MLKNIVKIEKFLKFGRMRNLKIEGKVAVFQVLAVSKIMYLALTINIYATVIKELNKMQKEFIWRCKNLQIKQSTLCNKLENGGLKSVSLKIKRLILNLFLINTYLKKNSKFKFNLEIFCHIVNQFPYYYQNTLNFYGTTTYVLASPPSINSQVL